MDDHGLVEHEHSAPFVVAPDSTSSWVRRGPTEDRAEHRKGRRDPGVLVDLGLAVSLHARDEEHDEHPLAAAESFGHELLVQYRSVRCGVKLGTVQPSLPCPQPTSRDIDSPSRVNAKLAR